MNQYCFSVTITCEAEPKEIGPEGLLRIGEALAQEMFQFPRTSEVLFDRAQLTKVDREVGHGHHQ